MEPLGACFAPLGGLFSASWGLLGASWGPRGASWEPLGGLSSAALGLLEASGGRELEMTVFFVSWPPLGPVLAPSWAVLGASWAVLGPSWAVLGPSWGPLGPSWGSLGPSWGGFWHPCRAKWGGPGGPGEGLGPRGAPKCAERAGRGGRRCAAGGLLETLLEGNLKDLKIGRIWKGVWHALHPW